MLFSRPYRARGELANIARVLESDHVHGDGPFSASASARLESITGARTALLTTSCTHALDMAAMLLDLRPGDEVIVPSFTFPSAATAVVARGATPVFVDIDERTAALDPEAVEAAVTPSTRAVTVMHYGGVPADLAALERIAERHDLALVEDNAHGLGATDGRGRVLGTVGVLGAQSFHDTKNVHCGEGGALLVNDPTLLERAEIMREKGTDRARFLRGEVDKYTWRDTGSSFLLSDLNAALLDAQLVEFDEIQSARGAIWNAYAEGLRDWADREGVRLMSDDPDLLHAAHLYYLVVDSGATRARLLDHLRSRGIRATFHYVPLHSSPAGVRYGRTPSPVERTDAFSSRVVRLPLWAGMTPTQVDRVVDAVREFVPGSPASGR
ncbi:dTDP-4-amino-4,6-dideoxygalactose transaminase [Humibacter sp. BT305]|nr:dTDP-4-amino-4,6-dideoxygalactose transaminase [Humibacter sp. BT305]